MIINIVNNVITISRVYIRTLLLVSFLIISLNFFHALPNSMTVLDVIYLVTELWLLVMFINSCCFVTLYSHSLLYVANAETLTSM